MEVGPEIGYADHHIIVCIPGHAYQWSPERIILRNFSRPEYQMDHHKSFRW